MKLALLWIAPILLSACHYRVYVNKQKVYQGPGVSSKWLHANYSFLVVGKSEQMPDSAVLIEKTVASYLWARSLSRYKPCSGRSVKTGSSKNRCESDQNNLGK